MPVLPPAPVSFPPLLDSQQWKGASQCRTFPGSDFTWKQALRPRPLAHEPSEQTVRDLQVACGVHFNLLQRATNIDEELVKRINTGSAPPPPPVTSASRSAPLMPGAPAKGMPLYSEAWPNTSPPDFSVFEYCKKVGHAPPPNTMPAPQVNDMKSWFATYGHPSMMASGFLSEFSASTKSVPRSDGLPSQQVRLYRGRVLR